VPLDDYDRAFIEARKRRAGTADKAEFDEAVLNASVRIFECAMEKRPEHVRRFLYAAPRLQIGMIQHIPRSTYYERMLTKFDGAFAAAREGKSFDPDLSWPNAAFTFIPWIAQELEGPVKKTLHVVGWAIQLCHDGVMEWQDFLEKFRYLSGAIRGIKGNICSPGAWWKFADGLQPDDHPLKAVFVRNAASHSDYLVKGDTLDAGSVEFAEGDEVVEVPAGDLLSLLPLVEDLVGLLNVALHLGLRRWTAQPPPGTPAPPPPR
jgi:hypothetical protein